MSIYCKYLVSDFHEVDDSAEELQPGGLDLLVPSAKEKNEKMKLCFVAKHTKQRKEGWQHFLDLGKGSCFCTVCSFCG